MVVPGVGPVEEVWAAHVWAGRSGPWRVAALEKRSDSLALFQSETRSVLEELEEQHLKITDYFSRKFINCLPLSSDSPLPAVALKFVWKVMFRIWR